MSSDRQRNFSAGQNRINHDDQQNAYYANTHQPSLPPYQQQGYYQPEPTHPSFLSQPIYHTQPYPEFSQPDFPYQQYPDPYYPIQEYPDYQQQAHTQAPYPQPSTYPQPTSLYIPFPDPLLTIPTAPEPSYTAPTDPPQNTQPIERIAPQSDLDAAKVPKKGPKLVFRRPVSHQPDDTSNSANMHSSRRASSSRHVKAEQGLYTATGRPSRSSRGGGISYAEPEDSDEEVVAAPISTRTGRKSRAPTRYGEENGLGEEDDFEDKMMTSPVVPDSHEKRRSSRGRGLNVNDFAIPSVDEADEDVYADGSPAPRRTVRAFPPRSNRRSQVVHEEDGEGEYVEAPVQHLRQSTRSTRQKSRHASADDEEDYNPDEKEEVESGSATETDRAPSDIVVDDEDDDFIESDGSYGGYRRARPKPKPVKRNNRSAPKRSTRSSARVARSPSEGSDGMPKKRELRERTKAINYRLPPPDITFELEQQALEKIDNRIGSLGNVGRKKASHFSGTLPWLVNAAPKATRPMGDDDSDSDIELAGMKGVPGMPGVQPGTSGGQAAIGGAGAMKTDVANFGRVNPKSNLADADPLGVGMNVTFDNVGGLDNHINQLKEMVALPLLYPEIYQQFGVTPPRGVLFHGPPGTGKTLLARALAASCNNGNTKIAFFMRKGADVLSKWVGEAERQLRMLFEEARNAQPSIIFFDEIDGLAPVRSSKQDQIHASLVSTLLALMDGMDGRGQVIVIGATNRPDSVDPALRRPGRFDREFYFPLPNKEARKKIIGINTRKWSPGVSDEMLDQLAGLTKGYGGADLRSLCTEAALNAVQRRYPQIYSSTNRLLLDPSSIKVGAKDFMMSVKKIIPSSARSASSAATPLPAHLVPLLDEPLARLKGAVDKVLPREKTKTALEEAQFEDDIGEDLDQHAMVHALDKMRTFRPRILVHGPAGMGQTYLGPAILHHLEGFHVQSMDLGALMGDSTNTMEAALVQRFVEAKRHQPSVLFIPSLLSWSLAMTDTARTTFRSLLDSVPASDSVLLLAMLDGPIDELPKEVRRWFGIGQEGRVHLSPPDAVAREEYFASLVETYQKPPTAFPDALPRRKRVLEVLPIAPPLPPREPTREEIEREEKELLHTRNVLHWSFAGLWPDIPKKFDRYARAAQDGAKAAHQFWLNEIAKAEAQQAEVIAQRAARAEAVATEGADHLDLNGLVQPMPSSAPAILTSVAPIDAPVATLLEPVEPPSVQNLFDADSPIVPPALLPELDTITAAPIPPGELVDVEIPPPPTWSPHEINFDIIQGRLNNHKYHTPGDFKADIEKILENAIHSQDQMIITKAQELSTVIENHIKEFDHATWGPKFERYKIKMEEKKAEKRKKRLEREKEAVEAVNGDTVQVSAQAEGSTKRGREDEGDEPNGKRQKNDMDIDPPNESTLLSNPLPIPSIPSPLPAPTPVYPPFICPEQDLSELVLDLKEKTGGLNIDLLEQLRAGCYDRLWRVRGDWDRRKVIKETRMFVDEFVQEVEALEGSD